MSGAPQHVIDQRHHSLTFGYGAARGRGFVFIVGIGIRIACRGSFGTFPSLEIKTLVLEGVREFMSQDRLLRVGREPVEQVHLLRFDIVISRDLLLEKLYK